MNRRPGSDGDVSRVLTRRELLHRAGCCVAAIGAAAVTHHSERSKSRVRCPSGLLLDIPRQIFSPASCFEQKIRR